MGPIFACQLMSLLFDSHRLFNLDMESYSTEDLINELERRVDCSKRRGVRTILIGNSVLPCY